MERHEHRKDRRRVERTDNGRRRAEDETTSQAAPSVSSTSRPRRGDHARPTRLVYVRRLARDDDFRGSTTSIERREGNKSRHRRHSRHGHRRRPAEQLDSVAKTESRSGVEPPKPQQVECLACADTLPPAQVIQLECTHAMCHSCICRLFSLSVTDPQHMPPKCCDQSPINFTRVAHLFDSAFKRKYKRKCLEFSTEDRLYCPRKRCSHWIRPEYMRHERTSSLLSARSTTRKVAVCSRCNTKICCRCRSIYHKSSTCPQSDETQRLFTTMSREKGWQVCHSCRATVERTTGCNHMTCRCGAEFCASCGTKWKSCDCKLFSDEAVREMTAAMNPHDHDVFGVREVYGARDEFIGTPEHLVPLVGQFGHIFGFIEHPARLDRQFPHFEHARRIRGAHVGLHAEQAGAALGAAAAALFLRPGGEDDVVRRMGRMNVH